MATVKRAVHRASHRLGHCPGLRQRPRMMYRLRAIRYVGGISPLAGCEGQISMFVSDVKIPPNRAGIIAITPVDSFCTDTDPILGRIGSRDR